MLSGKLNYPITDYLTEPSLDYFWGNRNRTNIVGKKTLVKLNFTKKFLPALKVLTYYVL